MNSREYLVNSVVEEAVEVSDVALHIGHACNNIAKFGAKANRFGLLDINPCTGKTNVQELVDEYNDLTTMMNLLKLQTLAEGHPFPEMVDPNAIQAKIEKFLRYSEYSVESGTLETPSTVVTWADVMKSRGIPE